MKIEEQINEYIQNLPEPKRMDLQALHDIILSLNPNAKLWFLTGKNSEGKVVSNPNIGYGEYIINYADGKTKPFYQVGLSANTTGISVYIMGLEDRNYLINAYENKIGKAKLTGYCIRFKALKDINIDTLKEAIRFGFENHSK
ncbi:MAG: DUF1801 domain-containing protein [Saprospiraceae bacterium]|nr:DUF1801 domain-containing protein [Saprospiraceae bacterium]